MGKGALELRTVIHWEGTRAAVLGWRLEECMEDIAGLFIWSCWLCQVPFSPWGAQLLPCFPALVLFAAVYFGFYAELRCPGPWWLWIWITDRLGLRTLSSRCESHHGSGMWATLQIRSCDCKGCSPKSGFWTLHGDRPNPRSLLRLNSSLCHEHNQQWT